VRQQVQGLTDYFLKWSPPEGTTLHGLYPSLDLKQVFGLWEADTPNVMSVVTAQFIEWMDIDVVPVLPAEETVAAEAAGGLVELS
jgi:hypothetical protein